MSIISSTTGVTLDLTKAVYLMFRILPFLVATVLSLAPIMLFSWKGAPYLALLLLTLSASSLLGPAVTSAVHMVAGLLPDRIASALSAISPTASTDAAKEVDTVCGAFVLGSGAQPYSVAAPLDLTLLAFSTLYLLYFIDRNKLDQIYWPIQLVFPALTAAYMYYLLKHGCTSLLRTMIALLIGGVCGWFGGAFVAETFPSLMYLSAPSSRQSCTRIDGETYTCRGGSDHNRNAD